MLYAPTIKLSNYFIIFFCQALTSHDLKRNIRRACGLTSAVRQKCVDPLNQCQFKFILKKRVLPFRQSISYDHVVSMLYSRLKALH